MYYLTKPINVSLGQDVHAQQDRICKALRLNARDISKTWLYKQSVDARNKRDVHFVCSYVVQTDKTPQNARPYALPVDALEQVVKVSSRPKCVIVGAGPSGLFAASYLARSGFAVTVIERGSDVEERKAKVSAYFNGGEFDEDCNVQYGLGGAGTFSDGKLTSGISSPLTYTVFKELVRLGAPSNIMYEALPHIGTDKLTQVVANMREDLQSLGVEFLFNATVSDVVVDNGKACGIEYDCQGLQRVLYADNVILACGHSARDMFHSLVKHNVQLQFKPFAVGLRVEHTREFINTAQYGELFATHRDLGSASYKLVHQCPDGRGCYSFCMCPGGVVVPSNSQRNAVVVNGMSNFDRMAQNSNSALVVTVNAADIASFGFGDDVFSGVRFQEYLEKKAYEMGGGNYVAPCQNVADFRKNVVSKFFDVAPSYPRGVKSVNLNDLLPTEIANDIAVSLEAFDRSIKGFGSCGTLTGVETRTSSPVRVVRNADFESNISGIYPIGEGAGYAGGIVSSAVDGLRFAIALANKYV